METFFDAIKFFMQKMVQNFCKKKPMVIFASLLKKGTLLSGRKFVGPFVYRLGLKIFILARGVRFPYGLL